MAIFVYSEISLTTIPIDVSVDMKLSDVVKELPDSYNRPVFSYQGKDIYELSKELSDLGICPESTVSVREYNPSYMYRSGSDSYPSDHHIIIDTELEELHCIIYKNDLLIVEYYKLKKVDDKKYQSEIDSDYIYDLSKHICCNNVKDETYYYYPHTSCYIYTEVADKYELDKLIDKYPQFDINVYPLEG